MLPRGWRLVKDHRAHTDRRVGPKQQLLRVERRGYESPPLGRLPYANSRVGVPKVADSLVGMRGRQ